MRDIQDLCNQFAKEVNGKAQEFVKTLAVNNVIISAIHNHWVYTNPTILYVHFQSVEPPILFAKTTAQAFNTLKY